MFWESCQAQTNTVLTGSQLTFAAWVVVTPLEQGFSSRDDPVRQHTYGNVWMRFWSFQVVWRVCYLHWVNQDFVVVQSLSHGQYSATPCTAAGQASLSFTISWSLLKLMPIELVMPSNHLILCRPLLLPPSICPSIRVFSNNSALLIRWPKHWTFIISISPSNEYSGLFSFRID